MDVASVEGGGKGEKVGKVRDEEMASRSDELDSAGEVYEVYRTVATMIVLHQKHHSSLRRFNHHRSLTLHAPFFETVEKETGKL